VHIDVKKLAGIRCPGNRVHGDRSREVEGRGGSSSTSASTTPPVAYAEVLADEKAVTAVAGLRRAVTPSTVRSAWRWSGS
jgi:hypothetical protein